MLDVYLKTSTHKSWTKQVILYYLLQRKTPQYTSHIKPQRACELLL